MVKIRLHGINRAKKNLADGSRIKYHLIRGVKGSTFWRSDSQTKVGSPEYIAAYQKASRPEKDGEKFGAVTNAFFASGEFRKLAPRTQKDYRRWGDEIRDKFASAPISAVNNPKIRQIALRWRDQWDGRNADYAWTVLGRIVNWAYNRGLVEQHHLRGGGRLYKSHRAEIIWTEAERSSAWRRRPLPGSPVPSEPLRRPGCAQAT